MNIRPSSHSILVAADALWKKQPAINRKRRSKLALGRGRASANCRCLCGLILTTKGIHQHQRRCVVQQQSWNWPDMAKPAPLIPSNEPRQGPAR